VAGTFVVLVALGGLSKVVGFLREMLLAARFGADRQMDAFLIGYTLPGVAQRIFEDLVGASVLPLFASWIAASGETEACRRLGALVRLLFVSGCAFVLAAMVLARPLVWLFAPSFSGHDAAVAARCLQVMLPSVALGLLASAYTALLNYYHRFVWAALIALLANVSGLLCIVFYSHRLGVYSAALGITLTAFLSVVLAWPFLPSPSKCGPRSANFGPWLSEFAGLAKPLAIGILLFNLITFVERFLASWLPSGGVSILNYAFKVNWLFYMVLVVPITTMAFPRLARAEAGHDRERFLRLLRLSLKSALVLLVPAIVVLGVTGDSLIRLLYERGNFTPDRTTEAATLLRVFVFGLAPASATFIFFYALYALKQPASRVAAGGLGLAVAFGVGSLLVWMWGTIGVALTHVLNYTCLAVFLARALEGELGCGWWRPLLPFGFRVMMAGAGSFVFCRLMGGALLPAAGGASQVREVLQLALCGFVAVVSFLSLSCLLQLREARALAAEVLGSFRRRDA
jgi:putative peptidoglycan lipid II flippase